MSCIVFTLATAPGLEPVTGAAPWPVLARQLPRQLVVCLNGPGDRNVRFVPLIGVVDGKRRFLDPIGTIPFEVLLRVVPEGSFGYLVNGEIDVDRLRLRAHALPSGLECVDLSMEFDPRDPLPALRRAAFELGELVGARDATFGTPELPPPALSKWLEVRDHILALEANLLGAMAEQALAAASELLQLATESPAARDTFRDVVMHLARRGMLDSAKAALIETAVARAAGTPELGVRCAQAVECALGAAGAAPIWRRVAGTSLSDPDALAQAAASLFAVGDLDAVRRMLRGALARGCRDPNLRGQLAAVEDVAGDSSERDRLLSELWDESHDGLPPRVARLVASWLVDHERASDALSLLDRCAGGGDDVPGIWLERGRALVSLGRADEARGALAVALERGLSSEGAAEARRLLALCTRPDLVPSMLAVERDLAVRNLGQALRGARRLVQVHPDIAETWAMLGTVHVSLGNRWRAQRAFRRALLADPGSADAHARLGALLAARGRAEEGLSHLRHAAGLTPREATIWFQIAKACDRLGRREEAIAAFRRGRQLGGATEEARALSGRFGNDLAGPGTEGQE